jgi:hypothetical protein
VVVHDGITHDVAWLLAITRERASLHILLLNAQYNLRCIYGYPSILFLTLPCAMSLTLLDVRAPLAHVVNEYIETSKKSAQDGHIFRLFSPARLALLVLEIAYVLFQNLIVLAFAPPPPKSDEPLKNPRGRVAVIGAGLTGVSSAA